MYEEGTRFLVGFNAIKGALELTECTASNLSQGVTVAGCDTVLRDCIISSCDQGIYAYKQEVPSRPSTLHAVGCTVQKSRVHGIFASNGAVARLRNCRSIENKGVGYCCKHGARMTVTGCSSDRDGQACSVGGEHSELLIQELTVDGVVRSGMVPATERSTAQKSQES